MPPASARASRARLPRPLIPQLTKLTKSVPPALPAPTHPATDETDEERPSREDDKEFGFFGEFREVDAPKRLVHAENYDPGDVGGAMPSGEPAIITTELEQEGNVTTLTTTMLFASKEARDGAVSTGMTDGMEMSYALLDEVFAKAA